MMTWNDLYMMIHEKELSDQNFMHEGVIVYNADTGDFDLADVLEFGESDGIIDTGKTVISINAEKYSEQEDNT